MKFSNITAANLAKAANPSVDFDGSVAANPANSANPAGSDEQVSKISDFSKGNTRENAKFASVRCSDCQHAQPATATDPHSWHGCDRGLKGWWGMAPHRCESWEGKR